MKAAVAAIAAVLCVLLAGCASHRPAVTSSPPADPPTSTVLTATPSQHSVVATVSQYADLLRKPVAALRSDWTAYTNADCASGRRTPTCVQGPLTLN